jgi:hypothetical protein
MTAMRLLGFMLRRPVTASLIGAGLVLLCFALASAVAALRVTQVEKRWARTFGSWEEIAERHPSRGTNEPARTLERLAAPLGIELAPRSSNGRNRPSARAAAEFAEIREELGLYMDRQLERPRRAIEPPPEAVAIYLQAHEDDVEAVRRQLQGGAEPRWELRPEMLGEVQLPNLLGHLNLQMVLLADALVRARVGDDEAALSDLEASWRLNAAIREDPVLVTQLAAIAVNRRQIGTLRQLDEAPARWRDRLIEHDARRSLLEALSFEGRVWIRLDESPELRDASKVRQRVFWAAVRPLIRFSLADVSDRYRRRLENLAAVDAICDTDLRNTESDLNPPIPKWNLIGGAVMPDFADLPGRSARLELDLELTTKLLEARTARRENDGRWPESLPGIGRSLACPGDHWLYEATPDGAMSIVFSREVSWPEPKDKGVMLPMRYVEAL